MNDTSIKSAAVLILAAALFSCGEDEVTEPEPNRDPTVEILTPAEGQIFPHGDSIYFSAEAENFSGTGLQPGLLTWVSDSDDTIGTGYSFYRDDLSINSHAISLRGCDMGGNCSSDGVAIQVRSNQPPEVTINSPPDGSSYLEGEEITFRGGGIDYEDGALSGGGLIWESARDGYFGTGDSVVTDQLSGQIHLVILNGTDSDMNSSSDSIMVYITHSMVSVPAVSEFPMGGGVEPDENPVHDLAISAYSIGRFEVTYDLWLRVKSWGESNNYSFANDGQPGYGTGADGQHPVVMIGWRDCVAWCNAFSEMAGYSPVYYRSSARIELYRDSSVQEDIVNSCVDWAADGYRLPTEAEWECAARYIDGSRFSNSGKHSGSNSYPDPDDCAWHEGNSGLKSHRVGGLGPNSLGLYDMSGNVWEWCWDRYDADYYSVSPAEDPVGPDSGSSRTGRGGSWNVDVDTRCHTSERLGHNISLVTLDFGFRVCRSAP